MTVAWIEEQEDTDDPEEALSPRPFCRGATWEFPRLQRSHDWMWAEEPTAGPDRYAITYQARLHHALADLHRISSELRDLSQSALAPPLESLRAAMEQVSTSLEMFGEFPLPTASAAHEVIDWRSINREQWSRGITARVDEDGNPVALISEPAQLRSAVESDEEEPLLDE